MGRPVVASREFEAALERATGGRVDLDDAQTLFRGAATTARREALFSTASEVRDRALGRRLRLTAHLHMVTECGVSPSCNYCSLSSTLPSVNRERAALTERRVLRGVRMATERGVDGILLVGGTNFDGSDAAMRSLLPQVRDATTAQIAIDVGPSVSESTLRWMKRLRVRTVYCSVETINPRAFARAKPGDRLDGRLAFMDLVDRVGLDLGNVVMNGLGSADDLLRSILHSQRFRHLTHLHISTFQPVRGTPWARRRPASVRTSLIALAIARLAFPRVQLGLAEVGIEDPKGVGRPPNQLEVGGGNTLAGLLLYRDTHLDQLDHLRKTVAEMGFELSPSLALRT